MVYIDKIKGSPVCAVVVGREEEEEILVEDLVCGLERLNTREEEEEEEEEEDEEEEDLEDVEMLEEMIAEVFSGSRNRKKEISK